MHATQSFWVYFTDAGLVVKAVMLLLLTASVLSWTVIIQRTLFYKKIHKAIENFDDRFWSGIDMMKLYEKLDDEQTLGLARIFKAGFGEFVNLKKKSAQEAPLWLERIHRAMRVAQAHETDKLQLHLPFLASVGSISPYVGLFGTVWGIMTSFHALGAVQQATIAMVAPGISEALIATAMGLFAAIPAVLAYNRFATASERIMNQYETFQDEFSNILQRQIQGD